MIALEQKKKVKIHLTLQNVSCQRAVLTGKRENRELFSNLRAGCLFHRNDCGTFPSKLREWASLESTANLLML